MLAFAHKYRPRNSYVRTRVPFAIHRDLDVYSAFPYDSIQIRTPILPRSMNPLLPSSSPLTPGWQASINYESVNQSTYTVVGAHLKFSVARKLKKVKLCFTKAGRGPRLHLSLPLITDINSHECFSTYSLPYRGVYAP